MLLLGPPRSGKTSGVIVPTVLAHPGAAVCTSTKPDVAAATARARSRLGRVWSFDPTGGEPQAGLEPLRWSPVSCSRSWDGALLMARAMSAQVGAGTTNASHWAMRAQALLAPFLHAAAIDGRDVECVVDWVMRHELDEAGVLLEHEQASRLAFGSLIGLLNTEDRERASIFSAAADALQAYTSEAALEAAKDPNFDPAAFTGSWDTIYINAAAEDQAAASPLVCGLLAEIRRATYLAHRQGTLKQPMLFALDEVANIAPLQELPQIASEGGGQGLVLLAALQDLSQARARWGTAAEGFLTASPAPSRNTSSHPIADPHRVYAAHPGALPRRDREHPHRACAAPRRNRVGAPHPDPRAHQRAMEDDPRHAHRRALTPDGRRPPRRAAS